jgi:hypothetical protein
MAQTPTIEPATTAEALRLEEAREKGVHWRQWGPYLSERQWGTVREDYSQDGNAWDYLLVAGFQTDRIGLQGPGIADFGALA